MEKIRQSQLEQLELKKRYQLSSKNEILSGSEFGELTKDNAFLRNMQILEELKNRRERNHTWINDDYDLLRELKEKYTSSTKETKTKDYEDGNMSLQFSKDQQQPPNMLASTSKSQHEESIYDETLLSPMITPRVRDYRDRTRSPSPSNLKITQAISEIPDINVESGDESEESIHVLQLEEVSPPRNTYGSIFKETLESKTGKEREVEDTFSPLISPRVSDRRERMVSPNPSKQQSYESDEEFTNDIKTRPTNDPEELSLDQFLRLFDIITSRMGLCDRNYRRDYLEESGTMGDRDKDQEKVIIRELSNRGTSGSSLEAVSITTLTSFLLTSLPRICIQIHFDLSQLLNSQFGSLMTAKDRGGIESFNSLIKKKLCHSKEHDLLWNKLTFHFQKLMRDGFLTVREILEVFSPLLMPTSSTVGNEEMVIDILSAWLSLSEKEAKPSSQGIMRTSVEDSSAFSDDDTVTFSSSTSARGKIPAKAKVGPEYITLWSSQKIVDSSGSKAISVDDDPNEDINVLFGRPPSKFVNVAVPNTSVNQQRLANSIRHIDDDIVSDYVTLPVNDPAKTGHNSDDDFDFYK